MIAISPKDLKALLSKVMPFAARSGWSLPEFAAVFIEARDGILTASATDRYVFGSARMEIESQEHSRGLLSITDCSRLVSLYPASRKGNDKLVTLDFTETKLNASQPDAAPLITAAFDLVQAVFPKSAYALMRAVRDESSSTPTTLNPALLAKFRHLGETLTIKSTGHVKPALITAHNFLGMVMPLRYPTGSDMSIQDWAAAEQAAWAAIIEPEAKAA